MTLLAQSRLAGGAFGHRPEQKATIRAYRPPATPTYGLNSYGRLTVLLLPILNSNERSRDRDRSGEFTGSLAAMKHGTSLRAEPASLPASLTLKAVRPQVRRARGSVSSRPFAFLSLRNVLRTQEKRVSRELGSVVVRENHPSQVRRGMPESKRRMVR